MDEHHDPFISGSDDVSTPSDLAQQVSALPHEVKTGSRRAFDGHLLHVRVDDVQLPSGRESVREIVEHPGSVVIVPVTRDRQVLLIRQYRYATGRYLLELPAGLIDPGEHVMETAARELKEETGYEAESLRHLTTIYVSPGYSRERSAIVLATGCRKVEHTPDQDEPIELIEVGIDTIPDLLVPGNTAIENAQTMLGLLWLLRLEASGEV